MLNPASGNALIGWSLNPLKSHGEVLTSVAALREVVDVGRELSELQPPHVAHEEGEDTCELPEVRVQLMDDFLVLAAHQLPRQLKHPLTEVLELGRPPVPLHRLWSGAATATVSSAVAAHQDARVVLQPVELVEDHQGTSSVLERQVEELAEQMQIVYGHLARPALHPVLVRRIAVYALHSHSGAALEGET